LVMQPASQQQLAQPVSDARVLAPRAEKRQAAAQAVSTEVMVRRGDSWMGRARTEHEKQSWNLLPDGEREALAGR